MELNVLAACSSGRTVALEERLRALALNDPVSNSVRVPFVRVAALANTTVEGDSTALLYDMRSLVCDGTQFRRLPERHVFTHCVRFGTHRLSSVTGDSTDVCHDVANVVPPK